MLPDTLVKLASFGTSGVCILIVFWCGRTITKLDDKTPKQVFQLFRLYLFLCAFIAVISALTGFAIARNNEQQTHELLKSVDEAERSFNALKTEAEAINLRLKAAENQPPSTPPKIAADVSREIGKAANNVGREAEKAGNDAKRASENVKKWIGRPFRL